MNACHIIDLEAIRNSLHEVQAQFESLNAQLDERRDPFDDVVCSNMLQGYELIDRLVADGVDLFDLQQIDWLIEINTTVLCGVAPAQRKEFAQRIAMTSSRFFDNDEGGVRDLLEWYNLHRSESAWKRAAGIFVRILSTPQLFIEGNHRSGSLIVSYLLMREGLPPFVLSTNNMVAFFNPASVIRRMPKNGFTALSQLPKIKKKYAAFLEEQSSPKFLLRSLDLKKHNGRKEIDSRSAKSTTMPAETSSRHPASQKTVHQLLQRHKLISDMLRKQEMPRHDLVESLVHKQNLVQLSQVLEKTDPAEIAHTLEGLSPEDQQIVWDQISKERKISVLHELPLSVAEVLLENGELMNEHPGIKAFQLSEGRLREIHINIREGLVETKPIWVDLVDPSFEERIWVANFFGIDLPDPNRLGDLESSARFYVEENGEIHLHSVFLLDRRDVSRNVEVAFILHKEILFSVRMEELPVFRMQRMRALSQSNYVSDAWEMLLDLYAADVEYSAEALENVYYGLEIAGKQVLSKQISDDDAATILTAIAHEEDLNGLIRRNVLDTRRAVSFMMRSRFLAKQQLDDAQQILRDIESLDGHTTFLFGKINFLIDATVGFININQNKVIKLLTVISVVFMPLNIIAGIGGMSEFSMMTEGVPWPISYGGFIIGLGIVAWITFLLLRFFSKKPS